MKTKSIIAMMLLIASTLTAQSVFVVQGISSSSAHSSLVEAINAATNGDYIYLPGGSFNIGNIKISKKLNLIGAGHYPDSTQATGRTALAGNIYFKNGANSSSLQGIYLSENIYMGDSLTTGVVSNILISRCNINSISMSYSGSSTNRGASNIFVRECIIRNEIIGSNTQGVLIENSIITGRVFYFDGNTVFNNNLFLYSSNMYTPINYVNSSDFNNNIFRTTYSIAANSLYNTFANCVFSSTSASASAGIYSNCKYGITYSNLFVNVPNISTFEYTSNYQLSETSAAKGAGTNGADCGIYGGENPYKEGAVPINPHIQFKNIPSYTDGQGKLNIQLKVAAQEK